MKLLKNKRVIINELAPNSLINYFESNDFRVEILKKQTSVYDAVSSHPDIFMFYDGLLFIEKGLSDQFEDGVICEELGNKYPDNVKFNICKVGNNIICRYDSISQTIKDYINEKSYNIINVKQGYSKCSTAVIDDNSIITSDKGITKACMLNGIDVLLIEQGHIKLEGLDYGFIGGACVSFSDKVFFNGNIKEHPSYKNIEKFINERNKKIEYMDYPLEDLGSFIITS